MVLAQLSSYCSSLIKNLIPERTAPRILITASTSGPHLSKFGKWPFSITLAAHADAPGPIVIWPFRTLLEDDSLALDYQGLTFEDIKTGELVQRFSIDVNYYFPNGPTATRENTIEIPGVRASGWWLSANSAKPPYVVEHSFKIPDLSEKETDDPFESVLYDITNQASGFVEGCKYRVGLGDTMSKVPWSRMGTKDEVFARGPIGVSTVRNGLQMELTNEVVFEVVA